MQETLAQLQSVVDEAKSAIESVTSETDLSQIQSTFLGQKGRLRELSKTLGSLPKDQRPVVGSAFSKAKDELQQAILARKEALLDSAASVNFDCTVPGETPSVGALHPITEMIYELNDAFLSLGFEIYEGPEITSEEFAFDNMNFPEDHPARDSMDTYWLSDDASDSSKLCLRPHLTGASVRYMRENPPPFRFVYPGRVYRNESVDARHERSFFQYELLVVDERVPFSSGHILIQTALERVFRKKVKTRMRAGFFPFVEPGFEIDMECVVCDGSGCSTCKHVGWLEVMPGGTPHPNVLAAGGIDPAKWTGFYVSMGLDRLVMMRSKIDDVRLFHSGDLEKLRSFVAGA